MPSLHEFQLGCRHAFLAGDSGALSDVLESSDQSSDAGISVYQNNARETFRLALAASYPIVEQLVGTECFAALSSRYRVAHASSEPDLQAFGEEFPRFLDWCYSDSPHRYFADVARLELATEQVLLEPETASLDTSVLAGIPAEALPHARLRASPASRLVASDFPILAIWRMHQCAESAPVSLDDGPGQVLILRRGTDAILHDLSALEFRLADRLSRGESIGSAFQVLSTIGSLAALQKALARLLGYCVFTDIY